MLVQALLLALLGRSDGVLNLYDGVQPSILSVSPSESSIMGGRQSSWLLMR